VDGDPNTKGLTVVVVEVVVDGIVVMSFWTHQGDV
jgi:hypothetical protein